MILEIYPVKKKPNKKLRLFKIWWDDERNIIFSIAITNYTKLLEKFKRKQEVLGKR